MAPSNNLRRAQRSLNEENGIPQSPSQALATPVRKRTTRSTTAESKKEPVKRASGKGSVTPKASDSEGSSSTQINKQSKVKKKPGRKPKAKSKAKKAQLSKAAKQSKDETTNEAVFSAESRESSLPQSQEPDENEHFNGTIKTPSPEGIKESGEQGKNDTTNDKSPTTINIDTQVVDADTEMVLYTEPAISQTNAGLFGTFAHITPSRQVISSNEVVASTSRRNVNSPAPTVVSPPKASSTSTNITVNESIPRQSTSQRRKSLPPVSKRIRNASTMRSQTKAHRIRLELAANALKPSFPDRYQAENRKRERAAETKEDDEHSEAPQRKKKTARWSFKPDDKGNLSLLPRDQIDPNDTSIVFLEHDEATKFISQEFERKKQVRFADRIAKEYSELTEEEKVAQQAKLAEENSQVTTQGLLGDSIHRDGSIRAMAWILDAGKKSMLEKVASLTSSDDYELRESLANDLMDLAYAVRAAGPQPKSIAPLERGNNSMAMEIAQPIEEEVNTNVNATSQQIPLQLEAPPRLAPVQPVGTPGRIYASIRKLRTFLPFGGTDPAPVNASNVLRPLDSPTPATRTGSTASKPKKATGKKAATSKSSQKVQGPSNIQTANSSGSSMTAPLNSESGTGAPASFVTKQASSPSEDEPYVDETLLRHQKFEKLAEHVYKVWTLGIPDTPSAPPPTKSILKTPTTRNPLVTAALARTPASQKRKIGSEAYPLTADGKIPGPGGNAYGLNDDYFYNAESSTDSEEERHIVKKHRMTPTLAKKKDKADITRLPASAPRQVTFAESSKPIPTIIYADTVLSDGESSDESSKGRSAERRQAKKIKSPDRKLEHAKDVKKPKASTGLPEVAKIPGSSMRVDKSIRMKYKGKGTHGVLRAFAHV